MGAVDNVASSLDTMGGLYTREKVCGAQPRLSLIIPEGINPGFINLLGALKSITGSALSIKFNETRASNSAAKEFRNVLSYGTVCANLVSKAQHVRFGEFIRESPKPQALGVLSSLLIIGRRGFIGRWGGTRGGGTRTGLRIASFRNN